MKCCYDINHFEKEYYKMTCIMLSKKGLSKPSEKSFQDENNKKNNLMFSTKNKKRKLSFHYFNNIQYPISKRARKD